MLQSFKTTIIGIIMAGLNMYANGIGYKQVLISIAMGIMGAVAKDFNVTGGSTASTQEAQSRTSSPKL